MLYTQTVETATLGLLKRLQSESILDSFYLAGGTALALYLGHRRSVDLDLFSPHPFDVLRLKDFLETEYGFRTDFLEKNTLKGSINGIKTDFITHAYELIESPYKEDLVTLYALEDIIAMKLSAIADNGTRLKDFIDIAFLSTRFSFVSMLKCYERKYPKSNVIRPLKALTYFEDIDFDESIMMLCGVYDWKRIEKRLVEMAGKQDKIFGTFPLKGKETCL